MTDADGAYLRELLGVDFTEHQLAIATHPLAPQLVVAGAGSGKTMVMAARVVHAVAHHGVPAGRILGLTFTNKAAGELAARVRTSLAKLPAALPAGPGDDVEADEDDQPTVATYHAYAAGIVRDHALRIGREPFTALLTEATQWQLAMRVVRAATGPFRHLNWTSPSVATKLVALAGELAEHGVDAALVRAVDAEVIAAIEALPATTVKAVRDIAACARTREELLTLVEDYTAAKERLDLLDYGDQVALAARIARTAPAVGTIERGRFSLVVLDEYQDTGVAQRQLLTALYGGGHPVTAVGDPNQAIYGWRGASVGNLLRFGDHFPRADGQRVDPQPLMTSFRCGGRILSAANAIAAGIGLASESRRPPLQVPGLSPRPGADEDGAVVLARVETDEDEAQWVAERIAGELDAGTRAGEIAVLARRRSDFARLHRALVDRDVPVEVVGLGGLLEMPEVADVVAVLSLLVDPTANAAAIRLLTGPRWRLGLRDLAALGRRADHLARLALRGETPAGDQGEPTGADADAGAGDGTTPDREPSDDAVEPSVADGLDHALQRVTDAIDPVDVAALLDAIDSPGDPSAYSSEALHRLRAVRSELTALRRLVGQPLVELVAEVVRTIGLDVEIEAEHERVAVARAANLAAFLDHAASFTGLEGESDLGAFLAYLHASADAENGLDIGAVSTADTVKLMTVHKAKGLEWDVVAVPGLVADVFPSKQGRTPWTRGGHVLPFAVRGDAADLPRLATYDKESVEAFTDDCRCDDRDEERRLAYVACTRPRRLLLASGYCWSRSRVSCCSPSPYLAELAALGAPAVEIDRWCDDPADDATNPLTAEAVQDVPWPRPPDEAGIQRRRTAAALVAAAAAELDRDRTTAAPAGAPRSSVGEQLELVSVAGTGAAGAGPRWAEEAALLLDELHRERSAVREVPLPRRLTASQVVALAHDPDELAQMLARPMPARPQPQARRGSRFHQWVEHLYGTVPLLDPDDLPGAGDAELSDAELTELQERFLAAGWGDRRPVAVEQPFELVVGGRLVRGRIDAVYPGLDGGYDVIDYKTGAVPKDFAAASLQLSVYRLAWADLRGVDPSMVSAGFLYVRTGELKRPDQLLGREELAALFGAAG
ncbi:MAG TPA: UvrD-helicase domain-containing protein [Mycobacteriales bacterium]|nr:UvrD-helicase domain-containing protein [Mycobacteriales bacterium]